MNLDLCKIGRYIHASRKRLGFTQAELAERLNVSAQSVSNWERGEGLPDVALLPDLARLFHCSVDVILWGGEGCSGYRRHVTVQQMKEVLSAIDRIGEWLGRDHFVYTCMIDSLNARMNTSIELSFADPRLHEVFAIELLLGCIQNGDYVDPRDVMAHLRDSRARDHLLLRLEEHGIR